MLRRLLPFHRGAAAELRARPATAPASRDWWRGDDGTDHRRRFTKAELDEGLLSCVDLTMHPGVTKHQLKACLRERCNRKRELSEWGAVRDAANAAGSRGVENIASDPRVISAFAAFQTAVCRPGAQGESAAVGCLKDCLVQPQTEGFLRRLFPTSESGGTGTDAAPATPRIAARLGSARNMVRRAPCGATAVGLSSALGLATPAAAGARRCCATSEDEDLKKSAVVAALRAAMLEQDATLKSDDGTTPSLDACLADKNVDAALEALVAALNAAIRNGLADFGSDETVKTALMKLHTALHNLNDNAAAKQMTGWFLFAGHEAVSRMVAEAKQPLAHGTVLDLEGSGSVQLQMHPKWALLLSPPVTRDDKGTGPQFLSCEALDSAGREHKQFGTLVRGASGSGKTWFMERVLMAMLLAKPNGTCLVATCRLRSLLSDSSPGTISIAKLRNALTKVLKKYRRPTGDVAVLLVIDEVGVEPGCLADENTWTSIGKTVGTAVAAAWGKDAKALVHVAAGGTFAEVGNKRLASDVATVAKVTLNPWSLSDFSIACSDTRIVGIISAVACEAPFLCAALSTARMARVAVSAAEEVWPASLGPAALTQASCAEFGMKLAKGYASENGLGNLFPSSRSEDAIQRAAQLRGAVGLCALRTVMDQAAFPDPAGLSDDPTKWARVAESYGMVECHRVVRNNKVEYLSCPLEYTMPPALVVVALYLMRVDFSLVANWHTLECATLLSHAISECFRDLTFENAVDVALSAAISPQGLPASLRNELPMISQEGLDRLRAGVASWGRAGKPTFRVAANGASEALIYVPSKRPVVHTHAFASLPDGFGPRVCFQAKYTDDATTQLNSANRLNEVTKAGLTVASTADQRAVLDAWHAQWQADDAAAPMGFPPSRTIEDFLKPGPTVGDAHCYPLGLLLTEPHRPAQQAPTGAPAGWNVRSGPPDGWTHRVGAGNDDQDVDRQATELVATLVREGVIGPASGAVAAAVKATLRRERKSATPQGSAVADADPGAKENVVTHGKRNGILNFAQKLIGTVRNFMKGATPTATHQDGKLWSVASATFRTASATAFEMSKTEVGDEALTREHREWIEFRFAVTRAERIAMAGSNPSLGRTISLWHRSSTDEPWQHVPCGPKPAMSRRFAAPPSEVGQEVLRRDLPYTLVAVTWVWVADVGDVRSLPVPRRLLGGGNAK